ncbi:hypothetical protein LUU34_00066000 [Aix galericulata]|nr:hypothetical protein LUU34_00066000 [Aix galericulata]
MACNQQDGIWPWGPGSIPGRERLGNGAEGGAGGGCGSSRGTGRASPPSSVCSLRLLHATQRAWQSGALSRWQDAQCLALGTHTHAGTPAAFRSPLRFEQRPLCHQRHSRGKRRLLLPLLLLLPPSARFQPRCLGDPASLPLPPGRAQGRARRPAHSRGSRPLPPGRPCRAAAMSRRCRCCRATRRRAGLARGATGAAGLGPVPGPGLSPAGLAALGRRWGGPRCSAAAALPGGGSPARSRWRRTALGCAAGPGAAAGCPPRPRPRVPELERPQAVTPGCVLVLASFPRVVFVT